MWRLAVRPGRRSCTMPASGRRIGWFERRHTSRYSVAHGWPWRERSRQRTCRTRIRGDYVEVADHLSPPRDQRRCDRHTEQRDACCPWGGRYRSRPDLQRDTVGSISSRPRLDIDTRCDARVPSVLAPFGSVRFHPVWVQGRGEKDRARWNALGADQRLFRNGASAARGYRRFRCRACGKQVNERSGGSLNRTQYPSDVIAVVVLWRLRYRLSLLTCRRCYWSAASY
jgi:hypothetical protein